MLNIVGQRKMRRKAGQGSQLDACGIEPHTRHTLVAQAMHFQPQFAEVQTLAGAILDIQRIKGKRVALRRDLRFQAPAQSIERQYAGRTVRIHQQVFAAQIGIEPPFTPLIHVHPRAHRERTGIQVRHAQPLLHQGHIEVFDIDKNLPEPILRRRGLMREQIAPHIHPCGQRLGWRHPQFETIAPAQPQQAYIDRVQLQQRCHSRPVVPHQASVVEHDFALAEQPIPQLAPASVWGHLLPGHEHTAVALAHRMHPRGYQLQTFKIRFQMQQRSPAHDRIDAVEGQRRHILVARSHAYPEGLQPGPAAFPARFETLNVHRLLQRRFQPLNELRAIAIDVGQDHHVQRQHAHRRHEGKREREPRHDMHERHERARQ